MHSEKVFVFILAAFCLWGQVHSQDSPPRAFVNGPTGTSADAEDDKQKPPESTFVNGPTAFSVEANEQLKGQTGEFVEDEEDLKNSNDTTGPAYVVSDVDLEDQVEDDQVEPKQFVNGHSGASAHSFQQNADADADAAAARGRISTDPKEDKKPEKKIEGFHTHTSDFSTDAPQWSFKGGEWSLVTLPDPDNHPNLPADILPSPALVVVTTEPLAKVHASRTLEGMENVTLHFRYFLSEGELPDGRPSLHVYQVKNDANLKMLATATTYGAWDVISVPLYYSGDSKIVFEGQRKRIDNEIAIDDITISGYHVPSEKDAAADGDEINNQTTVTTLDKETEEENGSTTENPDIPPTTEEEDIAVTEASEDEKEEEAGNVTEKTQETDGEENDTQVSETGTEQTDQDEQTTRSPEEEQPEITTIDSAVDVDLQGNDTVDVTGGNNSSVPVPTTYNPAIDYNTDLKQDNETDISDGTGDRLEANTTSDISTNSSLSSVELLGKETKTTLDERENATVPITDNITTSKMNDSLSGATTELPNVNQTVISYETTDSGNDGDGNETEISVISTSPSNSSGTTDKNNENGYNDTNTTNNVTYTTMYPESVGTEPNVLTNQTDPGVTGNQAGNNSTVNVTGEGNVTSVYVNPGMTTLSVSNPPEGEGSSDQDNATNPYDKTTLIHLTSLAPPGVNNTSQGSSNSYGNGTDSSVISDNDDSGGSWSIFKVFLVITLLGVAVLGFLYWRRQKRRDDEIPVFSRDSHSDYHNPTFDDDDYNFASKGTSHNYKSFD